MRRRLLGCVLVLTLGVLYGETPLGPAQRAYEYGIQLERVKHYGPALEAFQEALVHNPKLYLAEREAGNCSYYLGRYADAVGHYDRYLKARPSDAQIITFVGRIRERLKPVEATRVEPRRPWSWSLALDGGVVDVGTSDIKRFVSADDPATVSGPGSLLGALGGLELGATYRGILDVFGRLDVGPFKSVSVAAQDSSNATATLSLGEWSIVLGGRYRWQWRRQSLSAGLSIGPSFLSGAYSVTDPAPNDASGSILLSGISLVVEPSLVYEYRLTKRWGVEGMLGYRFADFPAVTGEGGSGSFSGGQASPLKLPDGTSVAFDDSGLFGRLGLVLHFGER